MVQIHFANISIHSVADNSGVFSGENVLQGRVYRGKKNEGFGEVTGQNNRLLWNRQIVIDTDVVGQWNERKRMESG